MSDDQLKRWRRKGLLPRPGQRHLTGVKGSEARYPSGTLQQLLLVCRLHRTERRLNELRFDVWWEDGWVEATALRESFTRLLDQPAAEIREIRRTHPDPEDAAEAVLELLGRGRGRSPVIRLLRRRVGRGENLESALHPLLVLAFGGEPIWEATDVGLEDIERHPKDLLAAVIGLTRAGLDRVFDEGLWLEAMPETPVEITKLRDSGLLDLERPSRLLTTATDADLERARPLAQAFSDQLAVVAQGVELAGGRDAAGLGIFSVMRRSDARWLRLWALRFAVALPRLVPEENSDVLSALATSLPSIEAALAIANAFPGYKPFLVSGGEALLANLSGEEREEIERNIDRFLVENPRLAGAVEAQEG